MSNAKPGPNSAPLCLCHTEQPRPDLCPVHNPGEVLRRLMQYPFEAIGKAGLSAAEAENEYLRGDRKCTKHKRLHWQEGVLDGQRWYNQYEDHK